MARSPESEDLQLLCPLCNHEVQVAPREEDMCPHCGAELHVFNDPEEANQYAEERKAAGETAHFRQVYNGPYWVVAHKATPLNMSA